MTNLVNHPKSHAHQELAVLHCRQIMRRLGELCKHKLSWVELLNVCNTLINSKTHSYHIISDDGVKTTLKLTPEKIVLGRSTQSIEEKGINLGISKTEWLEFLEWFQKSTIKYNHQLNAEQEEADRLHTKHLEPDTLVLLRRAEFSKYQNTFVNDLYRVVDCNKREVFLSSLFYDQEKVIRVARVHIKPFVNSELLKELPQQLQVMIGHTLDISDGSVPFDFDDLPSSYRRPKTRLQTLRDTKSDITSLQENLKRVLGPQLIANQVPTLSSSNSDSTIKGFLTNNSQRSNEQTESSRDTALTVPEAENRPRVTFAEKDTILSPDNSDNSSDFNPIHESTPLNKHSILSQVKNMFSPKSILQRPKDRSFVGSSEPDENSGPRRSTRTTKGKIGPKWWRNPNTPYGPYED